MRGGWQQNLQTKTLTCKECCGEFIGIKADWCSNNCYQKWRRRNDPVWRKARRQYERDWKYENGEDGEGQRKRLKGLRETAPWLLAIRTLKSRAQKRGLDYSLTKEWAAERWTGRCELTGIKFSSEVGRGSLRPFAASVDRIDNDVGYTPDNCRFVLCCINSFKGQMTDAQMRVVAVRLIEGMQMLESASEK